MKKQTLEVGSSEVRQVLGGISFFTQMDDASLNRIAKNISFRKYKRDEIILREGETCLGLCILQSGTVKLFRLSPLGHQFILHLCVEHEIFNEFSTFDGGTNEISVQAMEPSEIWVVDPAYLRDLVAKDIDFCKKVVEVFSQNYRGLVNNISNMAFTRRRSLKRDQNPGELE